MSGQAPIPLEAWNGWNPFRSPVDFFPDWNPFAPPHGSRAVNEKKPRSASPQELRRPVATSHQPAIQEKAAQATVPTRWRIVVMGDETLSRTALIVAVVLSSFMTKEGVCYPTLATITRACHFKNERSAKRGTKELRERGYLDVKKRFDTSNLYRATFPVATAS